MPSPELLKELELLVRSRHSLLLLNTVDDERVSSLLQELSVRLSLPRFSWSRTRGLRRTGEDAGVYNTTEASQALQHVQAARLPALYHFEDFGPLLSDAQVVARLKDVAVRYEGSAGAIVLNGLDLDVPESLRAHMTSIRLPTAGLDRYRDLLHRVVRELRQTMQVRVELTSDDTHRLLQNVRGLTIREAERVFVRAVLEDGKLCREDIESAIAAKREIVERDGLLEYFTVEENTVEIAGLEGLKDWLGKRHALFAEPQRAAEFGLPFPRGMLLIGVPGCGKSLCAKAVASEWKLPLLKLDPSALYSKYVGESERNFRRAIDVAERLSPLVLWIDEIEKAFATAGGEQDGGLSTRLLGSFLNWLQERRGDVFVVATANDIAKLPPELMRKGRFDEIFFVDLPSEEERRAIFEIHMRRRSLPAHVFNLDALATASEGFSGAEIEQAVISALYTAFAARTEVTTAGLLTELQATVPMSRTMGERFAALRKWAQGRAVRAGGIGVSETAGVRA